MAEQVRSRVIRLLIATTIILSNAVSGFGSAAPLPVGLSREDALSWVLLRSIGLVAGLFFLFVGSRFHRFLYATFFLLSAGLILFARLAPYSYMIALGSILALYLLFSAIHLVWPRLTSGMATIWILPALYVLFMIDSGSFEWNRTILLGLAAFGLCFGLTFPRVSRIPISVSIGIVFILASVPIDLSFFSVAAAAMGGILVQSVDFFVVRGVHREWMDTWSQRMEKWKSSFYSALGTGILMLFLLAGILLFGSPQVDIDRLEGIYGTRTEAVLMTEEGVRPGLLISPENVFYLTGRRWPLALIGSGKGFGARLGVLVRGRHPGREIENARVRKDSAELAAMREAARITSIAMAEVGKMVRPDITEKEIERRIESVFRREGAEAHAFRPVVGSGPNACLPHYQRNNATLKSGFVVVDIGCMVNGYCSDMTRTFPVNRTYSPTQRELADLVLKAKETAQSMLKPGVDYRNVDRAVREVFREAGMDACYLHTVGHHVGINVHDPMARTLEAGMVVTIEPGLYVTEGAPIESRYWNLGIRIEDTVLITDTGFEPLTHFIPVPFLSSREDQKEIINGPSPGEKAGKND